MFFSNLLLFFWAVVGILSIPFVMKTVVGISLIFFLRGVRMGLVNGSIPVILRARIPSIVVGCILLGLYYVVSFVLLCAALAAIGQTFRWIIFG